MSRIIILQILIHGCKSQAPIPVLLQQNGVFWQTENISTSSINQCNTGQTERSILIYLYFCWVLSELHRNTGKRIKMGPLYRAVCIAGRVVSWNTSFPDNVLLQREVANESLHILNPQPSCAKHSLNKLTGQTRPYSWNIHCIMNFVLVMEARSVDTGIYINFILILTCFPMKSMNPISVPGTTGHF